MTDETKPDEAKPARKPKVDPNGPVKDGVERFGQKVED